ncbi:MAG: NAD(P)/FAD-dependent oxidoreductase [Dehalococcoidales bacterium]|nr:NAD(P)/FAD-dependent oxidoreductase [Dehalococcoidales bacterium]
MYDVAVVGAGPAGSQVAFRLAALGYKVVVVEKKAEIDAPVCCTGIISQECFNSLAIDKDVVFRQASGARLLSPSGKLIRLWRSEPQVSIVDRPAFNAALASRAQRQGAEYRLNSPVVNVQVGDSGVCLNLSTQGNGTESIQARAVVIATGFASKLVGGLGLGKAGDFVIGSQAEVETIGVDEVEVYFGDEIAPGFFAWLVPTSPGKALVGLLSRRNPDDYLRKLLARLVTQGKIASAKVGMTHGGIPLQPLAKTYGERLVVVGSAAGQIKPTTGGGVFYGLLCADIAANHLNRALKSDNLSAENLSRYQREWRKRLGAELKIGCWARKLYERLSDHQLDQIFDIIESHGIAEALLKADDLSFDWHSKVVLRLMADRALAKAMMAIKIPWGREKKMVNS